MTVRRIVALAQALAIFLILVPGPQPVGPSSVQAAIDPWLDQTTAVHVFDVAGKGIGCQTGRRKFSGPRLPGDPPPPPGSEPTPTPVPSADPAESPAPTELEAATAAPTELEASATEEPTTEEPTTEEPTAEATTMLLAGTSVRLAQADPDATLPADEPSEQLVEPTTKPPTRRQAKNAGLIAGLDVSHHNGIVDFEQMKEVGNRFVYAKATQNTSFIDDQLLGNIKRARAAGLAVGAYHAFDYTLDGKAQADHFLDRAFRAGAIDGALPPVVDVECWPSIFSSSVHAVAAARLRDFTKRVYERTGRLPVVYASARSWREVVGDTDDFGQAPLWAACWGCDLPPSLALGWDDWTFWQWQAGISGASGVNALDRNFFSGSQRDLNRMRLRPLGVAGGDAATGKTRVGLDLGGRDATHLRTSPDGRDWTPWKAIGDRARANLEPVEGEQMLYVQLRAGRGMRSPVLSDSVTLDLTGPEMSEPVVSLREGPMDGLSLPVAIEWTASDELAGLSDAAIAVSCGDDAEVQTEAPGSAAPGDQTTWRGEAHVSGDSSCVATAIGRDGVGNTTVGTAPAVTTVLLSEQPSTSVSYEGEWQRLDDASTLDGSVHASASEAARVTASVTGRAVAIVAVPGPDGGRAAVSIDGQPVGLIETFATVSGGPQVVFTTDLEPGAPRAVTVQPLGTSDSAASGARVSIDGFIVLR